MKRRNRGIGCALVLVSTLAFGCKRSESTPSAEYVAAIAAYEDAMAESLGDYASPAFDEVLRLLSAVPAGSKGFELSQSIIADIEAERARAVAAKKEAQQRQSEEEAKSQATLEQMRKDVAEEKRRHDLAKQRSHQTYGVDSTAFQKPTLQTRRTTPDYRRMRSTSPPAGGSGGTAQSRMLAQQRQQKAKQCRDAYTRCIQRCNGCRSASAVKRDGDRLRSRPLTRPPPRVVQRGRNVWVEESPPTHVEVSYSSSGSINDNDCCLRCTEAQSSCSR